MRTCHCGHVAAGKLSSEEQLTEICHGSWKTTVGIAKQLKPLQYSKLLEGLPAVQLPAAMVVQPYPVLIICRPLVLLSTVRYPFSYLPIPICPATTQRPRQSHCVHPRPTSPTSLPKSHNKPFCYTCLHFSVDSHLSRLFTIFWDGFHFYSILSFRSSFLAVMHPSPLARSPKIPRR